MSRPRFLADHDLNENLVEGVLRREPTVEFVRAREFGLQEYSDPELLEWASREQWTIISHDVNTMSAAAYARVAAGKPMSGLILVRQRYPLAPIIEDLVLIWVAEEAEELTNLVRYLPL